MSKKLNTLLFALRHLQQDMERHPENYKEEGSHGELLDADGIDELCEELNFEVKPRAFAVVTGGVLGYLNDDGVDFVSFDFDNYDDDPDGQKGSVPSRFRDLGEQMGIPDDAYEQDDPEANEGQEESHSQAM
jgi:hypothetical protein